MQLCDTASNEETCPVLSHSDDNDDMLVGRFVM